ncbi:P-loop containing nucleoside triphosphate hydrolase protein [Pavlovales sp. CCMP2436]|nr:P-loop containing nucleoside triphosphate hydrolase protein [Pavlovales sp. CCMP2436]
MAAKIRAAAAGAMSSGQRPRIYARIRPETEGEERLFDSFDDQKLILESRDGQELTYNFDKVFAPDSKQSELVQTLVTGPGGVLTALRAGYDATVFAYGQTGSGKTYSMEGGRSWASDPETRGLVPRLFELIFTDLAGDPGISELQVTLSFTELYNESIRDLLQAKADLQVYQEPHGGFAPKGAMKAQITSVKHAIAVYLKGSAARATESTNMNATSSRSHALLILDLNWMVVGRGRRHARLNLLDLAGSEGLVKTGNLLGSQRAKEGIMINLSLLCLKRVVDALAKANRPSHIPFRESKLTRLLQSSLGGNNVLHILLALHNLKSSREESVDALRFASACARMRLAPKQNSMSTQLGDMPSIIKDQLSKIDNLERENADLRERVVERMKALVEVETLPVSSSALREELLNTESQIEQTEERVQALAQRRHTASEASRTRPGSAAAAGNAGLAAEALAEAQEEDEMETELRGLAADLATLLSNKADLELQLRQTGGGEAEAETLDAIEEGPGGEGGEGEKRSSPSKEVASAPVTIEALLAEIESVRAERDAASEATEAALAEKARMGEKLSALLRERDELLAETSSQQRTLGREAEERAAEALVYNESISSIRFELRDVQVRIYLICAFFKNGSFDVPTCSPMAYGHAIFCA